MARVELNIVALGDFSSVNSQIKALQVQVASLNKNLAGVGLSNTLAKDLAAAQAAFKATMLSTGQFTVQTVKMASETEKFGTALTAGKLKLSQYFDIISGKSGQAAASMKALAAEQVKLQSSLVMADPTKRGILSVYTPTQINQVTAATKLATMQQNLYNLAVMGSSKALITWGKNTQWAGRQLTVGLSMPMIMFGAVAVKSFKDANIELTRLQRLYGVGLTAPTNKDISAISTQVMDLGKKIATTMGIAQKETVATAADFAAIGRTGNDLLTATEQAMRLSKLGSIDSKQAFTGIMTLQNTFKVGSSDLAEAVNFMTAIQKQTALNLTDITDAFPRIGPIVRQLGGSYKDTAVMMLAMKEAGVPAAQAANALKSAMASMISPTTAAKDMFAKFNINLAAITTDTKGNPVKMVQALQKSLEGIEPLARAQLIEKLFGKFQFARVTALLDNLGKAGSQTQLGFKIAQASASDLSKLIDQEMRIATESTTAKWARAIEGFKATIYPVGQKFMEMGTIVLNIANKIGKAFSHLPGPIKSVLGIFAGLSLFAGPVIMLTGLLANFAGYILKGVVNIKALAKGGLTFKELLTPEIIASQNAAELFSAEIAKDVEAVDLLNQAVKQLTVTLEGMTSAMTTATSAEMANMAAQASAFTSPGLLKQYNRSHMSGPIVTMGYNEAVAAAKAGSIEINGAVHKLNAGLVTKILSLEKALEAGIISAEETALMQFKLLNNDVMLGSATMNRGLSRGMSYGTQEYLQGHMIPGMLTPAALLSEKTTGKVISGEAQLAVEAEYQKLTTQIMVQENKWRKINASRAEEVHIEVLERLNAAYTKEAETGNVLAAEQATLVQSIIAARTQASNLAINAGSADVARRIEAYNIAQGNKKIGFSTKEGGSSVRPVAAPNSYGSVATEPAIIKRNRLIGLAAGEELVKSETESIVKGEAASTLPVRKSGENIGRAVELGIQRGLKEAGFTTRQIAKMDLEKLGNELVPIAEREGYNSGKAYNIAMQRAMKQTPVAGVGMKGMGISMAAMMGGMALSGKGGAAGTAGSVLTNIGMVAMMSSFIPQLASKLPMVLAAVTALTLAYKGLQVVLERVKNHNIAVEATFKSNADALKIFGLNATGATSPIAILTDKVTTAGPAMSQFAKSVKEFTDAVNSLPKDNALKILLDEMTKSKAEVAGQLAKDFIITQMALNGIDPAKAQEMYNVMMGASKHVSAIGSKSNLPKSTQEAVSAYLGAAPDTSKQKGAFLTAPHVATYARDLKATKATDYTQLSDPAQKSADKIASVVDGLLNMDARTKQYSDTLAALNGKSVDQKAAMSALALSYGKTDKEVQKQVNLMNKNGISVAQAAQLFKASSLNSAGAAKTIMDNLTKGLKPDPKLWAQVAKEIADAAKNGDFGGGSTSSSITNLDTGSTTTFTGTVAEKELKKKLEAKIKIENSVLKTLKDQLSVEQKRTQEMQRQFDYQNNMQDLSNKSKEAMISGNYLEAAGLGQQRQFLTMQFNQGTVQNKLQGQIDVIQARTDVFSEALADLNDAIANGIKTINKTILQRYNLPVLNSKNTKVDSGGLAINVTVNSPSADHSAIANAARDKVLQALKTNNEKSNRTNHVILEGQHFRSMG